MGGGGGRGSPAPSTTHQIRSTVVRDPRYEEVPTILGRRPVGPTAMVAAKVVKELVSCLVRD